MFCGLQQIFFDSIHTLYLCHIMIQYFQINYFHIWNNALLFTEHLGALLLHRCIHDTFCLFCVRVRKMTKVFRALFPSQALSVVSWLRPRDCACKVANQDKIHKSCVALISAIHWYLPTCNPFDVSSWWLYHHNQFRTDTRDVLATHTFKINITSQSETNPSVYYMYCSYTTWLVIFWGNIWISIWNEMILALNCYWGINQYLILTVDVLSPR